MALRTSQSGDTQTPQLRQPLFQQAAPRCNSYHFMLHVAHNAHTRSSMLSTQTSKGAARMPRLPRQTTCHAHASRTPLVQHRPLHPISHEQRAGALVECIRYRQGHRGAHNHIQRLPARKAPGRGRPELRKALAHLHTNYERDAESRHGATTIVVSPAGPRIMFIFWSSNVKNIMPCCKESGLLRCTPSIHP